MKTIMAATAAMAAVGGLTYGIYALAHDGKDGMDDEELQTAVREEAVIEVDTMVLRRQTFQKQVLCNGRLAAIRRAELTCPKAGEMLQSVNVRNGQRVAAGMVLA
ncbi:MAG: hypothetical protein K2G86_02285, partial [Prevotella sp.]|nr:hypothetical protein [Prevotella sp.]